VNKAHELNVQLVERPITIIHSTLGWITTSSLIFNGWAGQLTPFGHQQQQLGTYIEQLPSKILSCDRSTLKGITILCKPQSQAHLHMPVVREVCPDKAVGDDDSF